MNDDRTPSSNRRVSSVNISADEIDMSDTREFGKGIFAVFYRLLRIGTIYAPSNELTEDAIDSFMELFDEAMSRRPDDGVDVEIRGDFFTINGETLRLGPTARERLRELRNVFTDVGLYRIHFQRGLSAADLSRLVGHLRRIMESEHVEDMEAVDVPHVRLFLGQPTRSVQKAFEEVDLTHYQAHLYTRLLVVVRNIARQYQKRGKLSVPTDRVRRMTRRIATTFGAGARRLLGWLPEGIMQSSAATRTVHSAIYGILVAEQLGLATERAGELGAGIVLEDVYWLEISPRPTRRPTDGAVDPGTRKQNVAALLDCIGGEQGSDASAFCQQLLFERGVPLGGQPDGSGISLASRIADVARRYTDDIQGYDQAHAYRPHAALQRLRERVGADLDAELVEAFGDAMGTYPPGTKVVLSNGESARVVAPPSAGASDDRPTVALPASPDRAIDLADQPESSPSISGLAGGEESSDSADAWVDELYLLR